MNAAAIPAAIRWAEIAPGYYLSELGEVHGPRGPMPMRIGPYGWPVFWPGVLPKRQLHRTVYQTFHGVQLQQNQLLMALDGNRLNCALSNLEIMGPTDLEPVKSMPGEVWRIYHPDPNIDPQQVSNMGRARGKRGLLPIRRSSKCGRWVFSSRQSEKGLFVAVYQAFVGPIPPGRGVKLTEIEYQPGVVFRPDQLRLA